MAGTPIKLEKGGETREVTTPQDQVRLEWNGWKVVSDKKKSGSSDNK